VTIILLEILKVYEKDNQNVKDEKKERIICIINIIEMYKLGCKYEILLSLILREDK